MKEVELGKDEGSGTKDVLKKLVKCQKMCTNVFNVLFLNRRPEGKIPWIVDRGRDGEVPVNRRPGGRVVSVIRRQRGAKTCKKTFLTDHVS